jgi:integrase/recombinase XerD
VPPTARELARAALRRDYEDYLRRQRGLTEQTIGHYWRFADRFLDFRFGETEVELGAITAGDIVAFLQRLTTRKPPYRDKTAPTHLRNFFRHLFKAGLTKSNLALCIPSVAQHYDARLAAPQSRRHHCGRAFEQADRAALFPGRSRKSAP